MLIPILAIVVGAEFLTIIIVALMCIADDSFSFKNDFVWIFSTFHVVVLLIAMVIGAISSILWGIHCLIN